MLLLLLACRDPGPAPVVTPDATDTAPGVLRLGPPAPSVGAYGIAAPPGSGKVYVSNLHVPFLTVADAATGEWIDAIDLREGCAEYAFFPRLYVAGDVLWITHTAEDRLCRYDVAASAWLAPVEVDGLGGVTVDGTDVWIATPDSLARHDGADFVEEIPAPGWASALDVDGDTFALLMGPDETVALLKRDGEVRWEADLRGELQDVALFEGRVVVTERRAGDVVTLVDGAEVDRLHTGSDTFAIDRLGGQLLVTNRQGAELPESGAYEGDPSLVTALDAELEVLWRVEVSKTIHFLAYDGELVWTANEDALRLSAIDPVAGVEVLRGEPIGLTIDHVSGDDGVVYFGSHLTDEVWRVDLAGEASVADVCGWPFVVVPASEGLVVPCEEDGEVWTLDPDTLAVRDSEDVAGTFFPACPEGLCTGHDALVGAASTDGGVAWSDPHEGALRWLGGASVDLGDFPEPGDIRHFDVAGLGATVLAFEPRTQTVYAVADGAVFGSLAITEESATFPLVADGDRVWVGGGALDGALSEVARLPTDLIAQAAGDGWIVAIEGEELVVVAADTLAEAGRVGLADLRVPPWRDMGGVLNPVRLRVAGGELLVANTMRGTIERRALPELGPLGDDTPLALGRWAEEEGIR